MTESFPFDHKTIVFKVGNKMFALADIEEFESFNVKCGPEKAIDLRERYQAVNPGFHMNKTHWNTIDLFERELPPRLIFKLIDHSYDMVVRGLPKRLRDKLYPGL